jgi:hypothetical protein
VKVPYRTRTSPLRAEANFGYGFANDAAGSA